MEHLRTRWAALVVALLLLLSVAGVAGAASVILPATAAPEAVDQLTEDGDEDTTEDEDTDADQDEDTTEDEDTDADQDEDTTEDSEAAQGEHGALVSAVAQNEECVGGDHENHGWAVSQVARGLLIPDVLTGCPPLVPPTVTTETTDTTDATENLNPAGKSKGKSGEHKKVKTHGRWASEP